MENKRQARIEEAYRNEISRLLVEQLREPRLRGVSITQVKLTPDLKLAKVYYNITDNQYQQPEINKGFENSKGFIKRELSLRVKLKYAPDIKFYFDETAELNSRMENLFQQITKLNATETPDNDQN